MRSIIIDSQFLDGIQYCEQKFDYDLVKHYKTVHTPKKLEMGSLVHDLYEIYYTNLNEKGHDESVRLANAEFMDMVMELDLNSMDAESCLKAFNESAEFWRGQSITVKSVEKPLTKLLYSDDELRIAYVSKIDLVFDGINFENMPMDHKTEHVRSDPNMMNNQFIGYAWATDSNRILINKIGFQKTLKPIDKFRRYPFYYSNGQIEEWVRQTTYWVRKMLELIDGRAPEMNRTSCDKWGGCKYLDVCRMSPENRADILLNQYKIGEPWSPFKEKELKA